MARTAADDESSGDEEPSQVFEEQSALSLSLHDIQSVLSTEAGGGDTDNRAGPKARAQRARETRRNQSMWSLTSESAQPLDTSGDAPTLGIQDYVKAARAMRRDAQGQIMPFRGGVKASAFVYEHGSEADVARWRLQLRAPLVSVSITEKPARSIVESLSENDHGQLVSKDTAIESAPAARVASNRPEMA